MRAVEIRTSAVPSYEVPAADVPEPGADPDLPLVADLVLDMKELAERDDESLIAGLMLVCFRIEAGNLPALIIQPDACLAVRYRGGFP